MTLRELERALIAAASAYLKAVVAEALTSTPSKNPVKTPLLLSPRGEPLAPPAKVKSPPPSKPSALGYAVHEKCCVKCGEIFRGRGNRQVKCEACGGGKSHKKKPTGASVSPRKGAIVAAPPKKARAETPAAVRYHLKPKPPAPDDPKKVEFHAWVREENKKRAARGKVIADRALALAGVGTDVEDVPLAAAIKKHP